MAARLNGFVGKEVVLGLRPENIADTVLEAAGREQTVLAMVEIIEPLGAETYLYATAGGHSLIGHQPMLTHSCLRERTVRPRLRLSR